MSLAIEDPRVRSLIVRFMTHEFNDLFHELQELRIALGILGLLPEFDGRIRELDRRIGRIRTAFLRAFPVIQFP